MGKHRIDVRVQTTAGRQAVYALLLDGASWPVWGPFDAFELERPGDDELAGVGAIRVFRAGRITSREQVVELVPDQRLGYELLSGLPLRDYRANVDLDPVNGGTAIHWHSSFDPRWPGTGWLYQMTLVRFIQRCAEGLAAHAAKTGSQR